MSKHTERWRTPIDLLELEIDDLGDLIDSWGEPAYRAKQVWGWIYQKHADSFDRMTNLPAPLRDRLISDCQIGGAALEREIESSDGETRKYLFRLHDGQLIETVLMEYDG